jgi:hypothetical protein
MVNGGWIGVGNFWACKKREKGFLGLDREA